jgi:hypothetical protein
VLPYTLQADKKKLQVRAGQNQQRKPQQKLVHAQLSCCVHLAKLLDCVTCSTRCLPGAIPSCAVQMAVTEEGERQDTLTSNVVSTVAHVYTRKPNLAVQTATAFCI